MNGKRLLRWSVAAAGLLFAGIGIAGGEPLEILRKAVRICLECIGIG